MTQDVLNKFQFTTQLLQLMMRLILPLCHFCSSSFRTFCTAVYLQWPQLSYWTTLAFEFHEVFTQNKCHLIYHQTYEQFSGARRAKENAMEQEQFRCVRHQLSVAFTAADELPSLLLRQRLTCGFGAAQVTDAGCCCYCNCAQLARSPSRLPSWRLSLFS